MSRSLTFIAKYMFFLNFLKPKEIFYSNSVAKKLQFIRVNLCCTTQEIDVEKKKLDLSGFPLKIVFQLHRIESPIDLVATKKGVFQYMLHIFFMLHIC
jgi:site-specific recombinase